MSDSIQHGPKGFRWGRSDGGPSFAAWAVPSGCLSSLAEVEKWVRSRTDMRRVRVVHLDGYRPRCSHLSIYPVDAGHPAMGNLQ